MRRMRRRSKQKRAQGLRSVLFPCVMFAEGEGLTYHQFLAVLEDEAALGSGLTLSQGTALKVVGC